MNRRLALSELEAARRQIRGAQRHYFAKRYSMMAHMRKADSRPR